jgi:hypothetical protein
MQWDDNDLVRMLSHIVCLSPPESAAASDPVHHHLCPGRWMQLGLCPVACLQRPYIQQGNSAVHLTNVHSTRQVHEHYKAQQKIENREENKMNILPGNEPGPSSL